jgi:hypothetical protein
VYEATDRFRSRSRNEDVKMACCAHVWIYHAILTPIPRRLRRPRPRSKSVYYEGNLKEISEFDGVNLNS